MSVSLEALSNSGEALGSAGSTVVECAKWLVTAVAGKLNLIIFDDVLFKNGLSVCFELTLGHS